MTITALVVVTLVAAAVLSQVIHVQVAPDSAAQKPFGQYSKFLSTIKHPGPIPLSDIYGNDSSSIISANQLAGLNAKIPAYVPSGLELKVIKTKMDQSGGQSNMVTLIYAPKQINIDAKTTITNVLDYNGVIAFYMKDSPDKDRAKWMNDYISSAPGAHAITIHGQQAIGTNGVPQNGMKSQVIFYDGDAEVIMFSVGYSESDLIKIAESMR